MITGINHVQITVPPDSADAVRRFYGSVLGLPEIPLPESMINRSLIWFRIGRTGELHVATEANVDRLATHAHIAYQVTDTRHWRDALGKLGHAPIEQPKLPGLDRFHFTDPFGNRVEIVGPDS